MQKLSNPGNNMRFFILFCLVLVASADSSEENGRDEDGGLHFDAREVAMACTAGSPIGAKLANAFATCLGASGTDTVEIATEGSTLPPTDGTALSTTTGSIVINRRRKPCRGRKCRGKGKKRCPGVEDIKEKIGAEMEDDLCILNQLGWIDSDGEAVEEVMTADLMTLPTDVSAKLSEDKIGSCADKMVSKMSKKHRRCAKMYSADDMAQLSELGLKVASYKCFQMQFAKSCQAFVREEIYDFYKAQIMQETTTTIA